MNLEGAKKPIQIKDFEYVFRQHPKKSFVGRKRIIKEIDSFLKAKNVMSPFLIIQGESGIGKTALMANYVRPKKKEIIHYFIKYGVTGLIDPLSFANHLYYALSELYKLELDNTVYSIPDKTKLLNDRLEEITKKCQKSAATQAIFIDALDESIVDRDLPRTETIVRVLNALSFDDKFRIVITTSRKLPEMTFSSLDVTPKRLFMKDDKEEYLADVEDYFRKNLSLKNFSKENIQELVESSKGNFQYAILAVKMLKENEVTVSWLIENTPRGLFELYDVKFKHIAERVNKETFNNIRSVMRTISLLNWIPTPETICDILHIDYSYIVAVFGPLEQFFDFGVYLDENICRWHNHSFHKYILSPERISKIERKRLIGEIVHYEQEDMMGWKNPGLDTACIEDLWSYSQETQTPGVFLSFMKDSFIPLCFASKGFDPVPYRGVLQFIACVVQETDDHNSILFFELLCEAVTYQEFNKEILPLTEKGQKSWKSMVNKVMKTTSGKQDTQLILVNAVQARVKRVIDRLELSFLVSEVFFRLRREFDDLQRLCERCSYYANKCFPLEETRTTITTTPALENRTLTQSDTEPEPEERADTVEVFLNGVYTTMERSKVEMYRRKKKKNEKRQDFTLFLHESNRELWFYGKKQTVSGQLAYPLLCLLARMEPEKVFSYEQILRIVWKGDPETLGRENMRAKIRKTIVRYIWTLGSKKQPLEKYVQIDKDGNGVLIAKGSTMLLIPDPLNSVRFLTFGFKA